MKQVFIGDYSWFAMKYLDAQYPHQRYGQAFLNEFYTGTNLTDPQLFYCEDKAKAVDLIFAHYITCVGDGAMKIGDKVKILSDWSAFYNYVGTITEIVEESSCPSTVVFDFDDEEYYFSENELEVVS